MRIRNIKPSDKEDIFEILKEAMSPQYLPLMNEEFDKILNGEYIGFVAIDDTTTLGYACIRPLVETYKLETIAVNQNMRNKGIGSELIIAISNYVRDNSKRIINVDTDSSDIRTINFYLRNGFRISGYVNDEYMGGVTQVHLSLTLEDNVKE